MIEEFLQIFVIASWILFILLLVRAFFRVLRREGILSAIKKTFSIKRWGIHLIFLLFVTTLHFSLVFIPPQYTGVVISMLDKGGIRKKPLLGGLHLIAPLLQRVEVYPLYWQTYTIVSNPLEGQQKGDDSITARTSDGQEVVINCSVLYRIAPDKVVNLHINWQHRYVEEMVRPIIRGTVRLVVSKFSVSEINSHSRRHAEKELSEHLKVIFSYNSLILEAFLLRDITFSSLYAQAVEQKQVAEQGTTRTEHEARQIANYAKGVAEKTRIAARADAQAIVVTAQADARAIVLQAQAQAEYFQRVAQALQINPNLLTYEYINKVAPQIKSFYLPNDAPLQLPKTALPPDLLSSAQGYSPQTPVYNDADSSLDPLVPALDSPPDIPDIPDLPSKTDEAQETTEKNGSEAAKPSAEKSDKKLPQKPAGNNHQQTSSAPADKQPSGKTGPLTDPFDLLPSAKGSQ